MVKSETTALPSDNAANRQPSDTNTPRHQGLDKIRGTATSDEDFKKPANGSMQATSTVLEMFYSLISETPKSQHILATKPTTDVQMDNEQLEKAQIPQPSTESSADCGAERNAPEANAGGVTRSPSDAMSLDDVNEVHARGMSWEELCRNQPLPDSGKQAECTCGAGKSGLKGLAASRFASPDEEVQPSSAGNFAINGVLFKAHKKTCPCFSQPSQPRKRLANSAEKLLHNDARKFRPEVPDFTPGDLGFGPLPVSAFTAPGFTPCLPPSSHSKSVLDSGPCFITSLPGELRIICTTSMTVVVINPLADGNTALGAGPQGSVVNVQPQPSLGVSGQHDGSQTMTSPSIGTEKTAKESKTLGLAASRWA